MKKLFLLAAVVAIITSCGISGKGHSDQSPRDVTILAVNDIHANIDNFPRFAFMVDSLRKIYPDMLLVSGGDNQTGNPVNDQYPEKGMPIIELMNAVGFNLSAIGNHEFDPRPDGFARIIDRAGFNFICANLSYSPTTTKRILPYKIITMPNGVKIAFTSVLNINSTGIPDTHPDNTKGFSFSNPFIAAKSMTYLKDSADVLIFLNHLGFENDVELANSLPRERVDLIIGGHSHTKVDKNQIHNGIMITQAERKLKYATLINLTIQSDGKVERSMKLLNIVGGNESKDIRLMVDKYKDNPMQHEKLAELEDDFTSYDQVGYLMTDALRSSAKSDIALINPGGIRSEHLSKGQISVFDVYTLDPFGNETILFYLTGEEILNLYKAAFDLDERLPLVASGLHSKYILSPDGSLKDVLLYTCDLAPIDLQKKYSVAMNNYMSSVYKYKHEDRGRPIFRQTAAGMIDYLRNMKTIPSYRNEKRIEMCN